MSKRKIELLAPAKDLQCGIEAIKHGADAVYIGAPMHSARSAAGNRIEDIAELVDYAHLFSAKIYVALNTILSDNELESVEKLIWQLYEIDVDAIIIQDMGITQLNLPPIALHASTQIDTRTVEKAVFLEKTGFQQIVLARELSINEIKNISEQVKTPIEVFVHGALCVCYSGQCYLSEALSERSANRGACAQYCRLPYDLIDSEGEEIVSKKHLLSMKDLNLSDDLENILDAGVSSLKIEGRLKDMGYVKNTVAYYRQKIDEIISLHPDKYKRTSSGTSTIEFEPNLEKSFNRGFTKYFLNDRVDNIWSVNSPKSIGEPIGRVISIGNYFIQIDTNLELNNGDGLCYFNSENDLVGMHVNRAEDDKVFPAQMPNIEVGAMLYRNFDQSFDNILSKDTAERKIKINLDFSDNDTGFTLSGIDEDVNSLSIDFEYKKELAKTNQTENLITNLSKLGNTIFEVEKVNIKTSQTWFIPMSLIAEWRRDFINQFTEIGQNKNKPKDVFLEKTTHPFPIPQISYLGNVMNNKSVLFYENHSSKVLQPAFEKQSQQDVALMFTKHCIKYSLGFCPKYHESRHPYKEPFYLNYNNINLKLEFDCKICEMKVFYELK